jgi:hypothetical protein
VRKRGCTRRCAETVCEAVREKGSMREGGCTQDGSRASKSLSIEREPECRARGSNRALEKYGEQAREHERGIQRHSKKPRARECEPRARERKPRAREHESQGTAGWARSCSPQRTKLNKSARVSQTAKSGYGPCSQLQPAELARAGSFGSGSAWLIPFWSSHA